MALDYSDYTEVSLWKHLEVLDMLPIAEASADAHMKFSLAQPNSSLMHMAAGDEQVMWRC